MTVTTPDIRKSDKWIPYLLIPFFAVIFLVNGIFIYLALTTHTGVVSDEAYNDGLAYNQILERAAIAKKLALQDDVIFNDGLLSWTLKTESGKPITTATAKARFIRAVQDGYDFDVTLHNNGKGVYSAPVKAPLRGAWTVKLDATLDAEWDNQLYQTTKRITIP